MRANTIAALGLAVLVVGMALTAVTVVVPAMADTESAEMPPHWGEVFSEQTQSDVEEPQPIRLTQTAGSAPKTQSLAASETTQQDNEAPSLSIDYDPTEPNTGQEVLFTTDASDPDGSIESYEWTIDGEVVWTGDRFSHSFDEAGGHVVSVTVTDNDGAETTRSTVVSVQDENDRPSVSIEFQPTDPALGEQVGFVAFADDSDGEIESYEWTVDGEDGGVGESISLRFNSTGEHVVIVTVTDDDGTEARATATVTVERESPVVSVDYEPINPDVDEWVEFTADASHPNGAVQRIEWVVDGTYIDDGSEFRYNFDEAGDHQVNVTVTDEDGDETKETTTVSVEENNQPPTVSLDSDTTAPTVGEDIDFTAATSDADGDIEDYEWTVDGDLAGSGARLTASFDEPGNYQVAVTVTDDDGDEAAATLTVTVEEENEPPSVSIVSQPASPTIGQNSQFTADASDSDGSVESYEWTVDGEVVGSGQTLTTTFDDPGEYQVVVTVTDDDSTDSTAMTTVSVEEENEPPSVSIVSEADAPEVNQTLQFTANASDPDGSVESYEWSVDGEVATSGPNLLTTFDEPGDHQITLTINDGDGAEAITTETITVQESDDDTGESTATPDDTEETDSTGESNGSDPDDSDDDEGSSLGLLLILGLFVVLLAAALGGYVYMNENQSSSTGHSLGSDSNE